MGGKPTDENKEFFGIASSSPGETHAIKALENLRGLWPSAGFDDDDCGF